MATVGCQRCNATLEELKTAQWDTYDSKVKFAAVETRNRKLRKWMRETLAQLRMHTMRVPEDEDLERLYPEVAAMSPQRPPARIG